MLLHFGGEFGHKISRNHQPRSNSFVGFDKLWNVGVTEPLKKPHRRFKLPVSMFGSGLG